jgi:mRNA-degrading endonuclease toxin of MazEF toxin-antitoxin module
MRHNPRHGIMSEFVKARPVIVDLLKERRLRRHLDIVIVRLVEGARPANAEVRASGGNQALRLGYRFAVGENRRTGKGAFRQAFALRDVKHGKTL